MNKQFIIGFISLMAVSLTMSSCIKESSAKVAKVGSATITEQDVSNRIQTFPPESQSFFQNEQNKQKLVDQLIDEEILLQYAKKNQIHKQETVKTTISDAKEQLKQQLKLAERRAILSALIEEQVDSQISVTEEDVQSYFDNNQSQYGAKEERLISHILVKDEKLAKSLRSQIRKGKSFESIAKKHSIDSTKDKGGDLGWVTADMLVPEFSKVAFSLRKKNQVSGVVKSPFGFHIIKYKAKKTRPAEKFEDVKQSIYNILYTNQRETKFNTVLQEAKDAIKVTKETPAAPDAAVTETTEDPQS